MAEDETFLEELVCGLDVYAASVGIVYEDVPRRCLREEEIHDLLDVVTAPCADHSGSVVGARRSKAPFPKHSDSFVGETAVERDPRRPISPVVQLFASWTLAHYCLNADDRSHIISADGTSTIIFMIDHLRPLLCCRSTSAGGGV